MKESDVKVVAFSEVEEPGPMSLPVDDVYWAVYNAVIEVMHPAVPVRWWYTKDGRAIRHAVARNAVQRLWDGEVHRDPGHGGRRRSA